MRNEMLRAQYEKRKAEARAPVVKSWASITSLLAFVFSTISVLFNIFIVLRETEDLAMVVSDVPWAEVVAPDQFSISADDKTTIVFMNSGTRSMTVLGIEFRADQYASPPKTHCTQSDAVDFAFLATSFEPTIVKGSDIVKSDMRVSRVVRANDIYKPTNKDGENVFQIPLSEKLKGNDMGRIQICLTAQYATSSRIGDSKTFLVGESRATADGSSDKELVLNKVDLVPKSLVPRTTTIRLR
jgi:hypothetical protein